MGLQSGLWTGLLGLKLIRFWQTLLERIDLLKVMFPGQTGLLRLKFFKIIDLLGRTIFKHTGLLGQIGLLG